jgi:Methyltransferase domain
MSTSSTESDLARRNIGGWLAEYGNGFDNEVDAHEVQDFESVNAERVAYFREYMRRYFNDSFITGQGTEHILRLFQDNQRPGSWLDVGAGTSTLFWSLSLPHASSVTCGDLVPEALAVLDEFRHSDEVPLCYREAASIIGTEAESLSARDLPWRYVVFDAHHPWPERLLPQYDVITACGCFGTARTPADYVTALAASRPFLKADGVLLGCDWSRSRAFVEGEGLDNRYMTAEFIESAAHRAGFAVIRRQQCPIVGDPLYDHVVAYALARQNCGF